MTTILLRTRKRCGAFSMMMLCLILHVLLFSDSANALMPHIHHRNRSGNSIDTSTTGGKILSVAIFGATTGFLYWAFQRKKAQLLRNWKLFEEKVSEAKEMVNKSVKENPSPIPGLVPDDGLYEFVHSYGRKNFSGTISIRFERLADGGWSIHGDGHNLRGHFTIIDGRASNDGTAFWVQRGREDRQTLSTGRFDFRNNQFEGCWTQTGNGLSGTYRTFHKR